MNKLCQFSRGYLGAVHKLCRLKIGDFWPPPPLLVVFLLGKIGNFWRYHNNHSWILAIHKDRIFSKNLLESKEIMSKNWVKNIQTAAYNGTRTVFEFGTWFSPSQALL